MALQARKYNQPITLIKISQLQDDFGKGAVGSREEVLHTFAKIIPISNSRIRIENTNAQQYTLQFLTRYFPTDFNAVRYGEHEYIVNSVTNVNMSNREMLIEAQRAE